MYNVDLDLEMAAARRHELEEEALRERLITEALKAHKSQAKLLDRLLKSLKAARDTTPSDPRNN